ncbi:MAG TPA: MarR family transcriptional regulator [Pseudonocardiaceae bacterium]
MSIVSESEGSGAARPDPDHLVELGRELGAVTVMLHSQIAEHLGLSVTDHKCLDLVIRAGEPITAGRIAALSGLSTGAVTGVVDRLERAGYVRRIPHPHDRRKVLVEAIGPDTSETAWIFDGLREATRKLAERYRPDELAAITSYLEGVVEVIRSETVRLRDTPRRRR